MKGDEKMGQVYQIPRVSFNLDVQSFNTTGDRYPLTNDQQLLVDQMFTQGIISGYRTRNFVTGRVTAGYLACDSGDCFLAYWRISINSCGWYYRVDQQCIVGTAYDRPPDTYDGYFSELTQAGLTRHTAQGTASEELVWALDPYETEAEALDAINEAVGRYYPITYRLTNCEAPYAPAEALVGDTVEVPFTFQEGYGVVNNDNVYVTNNGVIIPSTYANGVLTFTMPDPSQ